TSISTKGRSSRSSFRAPAAVHSHQGGTAMPATREVLSRPERLPDGPDSAAGMQHEYATRGEAGGRPARAKPRSWSPQPKPQPGQWAVRAVIKASILEQRLQIARLGCEDASGE